MEDVRKMFDKIKKIYLEILCNVFASFIKLVLIKDHIKHLWRTLGQFLCSYQLDVDVARLSLKSIELITN